MKIAIQNFYKLPQLVGEKAAGINGYVIELLKQGLVDYLYFDNSYPMDAYGRPWGVIASEILNTFSLLDLGVDKVDVIFSPKALRSRADVLLNFNTFRPCEFTDAVKKFDGLKIFHIMDYFWLDPASEKNKRAEEFGIDYMMGYSRAFYWCDYFASSFPNYEGKVIGVPYGFSDRFFSTTPFSDRIPKCVALGSVQPLRRSDSPQANWIESVEFYPEEEWFHKFRRMLVEKQEQLSDVMDSMLPVFPEISGHGYDQPAKMNEYQMFTACESLFNFPAAKTWEGPACGTVLVCSDDPCYSDYGFMDMINCLKYEKDSVDDFRRTVKKAIDDPGLARRIHENGTKFVRDNFNHPEIARRLKTMVRELYTSGGEVGSWPKESEEVGSSKVVPGTEEMLIVASQLAMAPGCIHACSTGDIVGGAAQLAPEARIQLSEGISGLELMSRGEGYYQLAYALRELAKNLSVPTTLTCDPVISPLDGYSHLWELCLKVESDVLSEEIPPSSDILSPFYLTSDHPWAKTATSRITNYYSCLSGIAREVKPRRILEIGTGFGLGTAALLSGCNLDEVELVVSLDLGIFSDEFGFDKNNIEFAKGKIHSWCTAVGLDSSIVKFYRVNTQSDGTDNSDAEADAPVWFENDELVALLEENNFDLMFVDGRHTDRGTFNDLTMFTKYAKQDGGIIVCDDLHDESYSHPWAGQALAGFHEFGKYAKDQIAESIIWQFPHVLPTGKEGERSWGLIRLKPPVPEVIQEEVAEESAPYLCIFTTPKAFVGDVGVIQRNAIMSWSRIPNSDITLVGDSPGTAEAAEEFGCTHVAKVDTDEYGTPLVKSVFEVGGRGRSTDMVESGVFNQNGLILAYVNCDIILTKEFYETVVEVARQYDEFLIIGQRHDVKNFDAGLAFEAGLEEGCIDDFLRNIAEDAPLHPPVGIDYFIFTKGLWDLDSMPEFSIGRTAWDNWLVSNAVQSGKVVIDATNRITALHQEHDFAHTKEEGETFQMGKVVARNRQMYNPDRSPVSGFVGDATVVLGKREEKKAPKKKRILFLTTYYPKVLEDAYRKNPELFTATAAEQKEALESLLFGDSTIYSDGMKKLGWESDTIIVNAAAIHRTWLKENGIEYGMEFEATVEQVKRFQPDVLYLLSTGLATDKFVNEIRPHIGLLVGQIACAVPSGIDFTHFDHIVTSFPHFVERLEGKNGVRPWYIPLAFDRGVLSKLKMADGKRERLVTFVGGVGPQFQSRTAFLEEIAKEIPELEFWGYGVEHLAEDSPLKACYKGAAWGADMFRILSESYITLNHHVDAAEDNANNLRLYEATGCGALLMTDYKKNLNEMFAVDEMVVYSSAEECVELVRSYLENPDEGEAIAKRGQIRTLRDHTTNLRFTDLSERLVHSLEGTKDTTEPYGVEAIQSNGGDKKPVVGIVASQVVTSGGVYVYVKTVIEALAHIKGYTFKIFVPPGEAGAIGNLTTLPVVSMPPTIMTQQEDVQRVGISNLSVSRCGFNQRAKMFFEGEGVDLLVFPAPWGMSFECGIPFLMAVHDLQHRIQPEFPEVSYGGIWEAREYLFKNAAAFCSGLLVDSGIGREDVLRYYNGMVSHHRVHVLPYVPYIVKKPSKLDEERVRARYELPEKYFFYPANFWFHKNHARLVEALSMLDDDSVNLVFTGSNTGGPEGEARVLCFKHMAYLSTSLGVEDRVRYLGRVSDEDMPSLYTLSRGLVMPTFFGPTNIPILEAWGYEVPVLTSDIRGIKRQAKGAAYLADPKSVASIAEGMRVLLDNKAMSVPVKKGRTKVREANKLEFFASGLEVAIRSSLRDAGQKEDKYLVSAIVSTYNSERFLRGCLDDLIGQSLYDKGQLEIVVVVSGSTDGDLEIVKEYQEEHDHIVVLETARETLYAAWNRGIRAASGKYVTNANTDDRHRQDALEKLAKVLEGRDDIALVYADLLVTDVENRTFGDMAHPASAGQHAAVGAFQWKEFDVETLKQACYMGPQPMWRRSLHRVFGYFDESFYTAGDWEFWIRMAVGGAKFLHIPEFLGLYLRSETGIAHSNKERWAREDMRIRRKYSLGAPLVPPTPSPEVEQRPPPNKSILYRGC